MVGLFVLKPAALGYVTLQQLFSPLLPYLPKFSGVVNIEFKPSLLHVPIEDDNVQLFNE